MKEKHFTLDFLKISISTVLIVICLLLAGCFIFLNADKKEVLAEENGDSLVTIVDTFYDLSGYEEFKNCKTNENIKFINWKLSNNIETSSLNDEGTNKYIGTQLIAQTSDSNGVVYKLICAKTGKEYTFGVSNNLFYIKEIYVNISGEKQFIGYGILSAKYASEQLFMDSSGYCKTIQKNIDDIKNFAWYFRFDHIGCDKDKFVFERPEFYGPISGVWEYYDKTCNLISYETNSSASTIKDGKVIFDKNVDISISANDIDNSCLYSFNSVLLFLVGIEKDKSSILYNLDGQPIYLNGEMGLGALVIEYTDIKGNKVNFIERDCFNQGKNNFIDSEVNVDWFKLENGCNLSFDKIGSYRITFYYTIYYRTNVLVFYRLRMTSTIEFKIENLDSTCDVVGKDGEEESVLNYFDFGVESNKIVCTYSGDNEEIKNIPSQDIINYVFGLDQNSDEYSTKYNDAVNSILKYCEYRVYFTTNGFCVDSGGNDKVDIYEYAYGEYGAEENSYSVKTPYKYDSKVYTYVSKNELVYKVACYVVYQKTNVDKIDFTNISYCFQDEKGKITNYAMGEVLLNIQENFPKGLVLYFRYKQIKPVEAEEFSDCSNLKRLINNSQEREDYIFEYKDIFGNITTFNLVLYPESAPYLNYEKLVEYSKKYNYNLEGYTVPIFNEETGEYVSTIYSTKNSAYLNFLYNVENSSLTTIENGIYNLSIPYINYSQKFSSQIEYLEMLNHVFDIVYEYKTIYPQLDRDLTFGDSDIFGSKIYLSKNFFFETNLFVPMFESSKIDFTYYDKYGYIIKSGKIVLGKNNLGDDTYAYGESLYKILADENPDNWVEGYVDFYETNSSGNTSSYTGYVDVDLADIEVIYRENIITHKGDIDLVEDKTVNAFKISKVGKSNNAVSVRYRAPYSDRYSIESYDSMDNISDTWFFRTGSYKICVSSTTSLEEAVYDIEIGNGNFLANTEKCETTSAIVKVKSLTKDVKIFINGQLVSMEPTFESGYFVYAFESGIQRDVIMMSDSDCFGFTQKGEIVFDLTDFEYYDSVDLSLEKIIELDKQVIEIKKIISQYESESTKFIEELNKVMAEIANINRNISGDNVSLTYEQKLDYKKQIDAIVKKVLKIEEVLYERTFNIIVPEEIKSFDKEDIVNSIAKIKSSATILSANSTKIKKQCFDLIEKINKLVYYDKFNLNRDEKLQFALESISTMTASVNKIANLDIKTKSDLNVDLKDIDNILLSINNLKTSTIELKNEITTIMFGDTFKNTSNLEDKAYANEVVLKIESKLKSIDELLLLAENKKKSINTAIIKVEVNCDDEFSIIDSFVQKKLNALIKINNYNSMSQVELENLLVLVNKMISDTVQQRTEIKSIKNQVELIKLSEMFKNSESKVNEYVEIAYSKINQCSNMIENLISIATQKRVAIYLALINIGRQDPIGLLTNEGV